MSQAVPRRHQDGPKTPTRWPKTSPRHPKTHPRRPKTPPRRFQDAPRRPPDAHQTPQDAPRTHPRRPKAPPRCPEDAPRRPQDAPKTFPRRISPCPTGQGILRERFNGCRSTSVVQSCERRHWPKAFTIINGVRCSRKHEACPARPTHGGPGGCARSDPTGDLKQLHKQMMEQSMK